MTTSDDQFCKWSFVREGNDGGEPLWASEKRPHRDAYLHGATLRDLSGEQAGCCYIPAQSHALFICAKPA